MILPVLSIKTKETTTTEVSDAVFTKDFNEPLLHQVITAYMAIGRSGSKAQKNRAAVRGGGKKPWSQKGTGRARAGTSRSPIWRSGGVTFAAQPRSYKQKINKKMYKGVIGIILSQLIRSKHLQVIKEFNIDSIKTKNIVALLAMLNIKDALLMTVELDKKLYLSARNLYNVGVCDVKNIDPVSLIGYENVVVSETALKKIEAML